MLASTRDNGRYMFRSKSSIARVARTMKTVKAEFSKSVSCSSMERNSVRQPMCGSFVVLRGGGGFHLHDCQFVDWMDSKWSVSFSLSTCGG
jgi:hypothetical protein